MQILYEKLKFHTVPGLRYNETIPNDQIPLECVAKEKIDE